MTLFKNNSMLVQQLIKQFSISFFIFLCFSYHQLKSLYLQNKLVGSVVIDIKGLTEDDVIEINKQEQKELKEFFKIRKIELLSKEQALAKLQQEFSDIMLPNWKDGSVEKNKEKTKEQLISIPEIARWAGITLYYKEKNFPDSAKILISTFPYNKNEYVTFSRSFINNHKINLIGCIKLWMDSCISYGDFNK
jgi:hypothetical protein